MSERTKYADMNVFLDELAQRTEDELFVETEIYVKKLFGDQPPGSVPKDEGELVEMLSRNRESDGFRRRLATAIGPESYAEVSRKAGLKVPPGPYSRGTGQYIPDEEDSDESTTAL